MAPETRENGVPRRSRPLGRLLGLLVPLLAYGGLIFLLSSQSRPLPFLPGAWLSYDKAAHVLEYGGLGFLLFRALDGLLPRRRGVLLAAVLAASLYGASDEWHQSFVPHRSCDLADWAADAAGALAGAGLGSLLLRRRRGQASILA